MITDIYLGFRQRPHFTIAVSRMIDDRFLALRATLDPDRIYDFITSLEGAREVQTSIVNRDGTYQVVTPNVGTPAGRVLHRAARDPRDRHRARRDRRPRHRLRVLPGWWRRTGRSSPRVSRDETQRVASLAATSRSPSWPRSSSWWSSWSPICGRRRLVRIEEERDQTKAPARARRQAGLGGRTGRPASPTRSTTRWRSSARKPA